MESLRHSSARDLAAFASELAKSEEDRRHLSDLVAVLRQRTSKEGDDDDEVFARERKLLEQRLEEAHLHLADIKTSWSDKITSLETQVQTYHCFCLLFLIDFLGRTIRQTSRRRGRRKETRRSGKGYVIRESAADGVRNRML